MGQFILLPQEQFDKFHVWGKPLTLDTSDIIYQVLCRLPTWHWFGDISVPSPPPDTDERWGCRGRR